MSLFIRRSGNRIKNAKRKKNWIQVEIESLMEILQWGFNNIQWEYNFWWNLRGFLAFNTPEKLPHNSVQGENNFHNKHSEFYWVQKKGSNANKPFDDKFFQTNSLFHQSGVMKSIFAKYTLILWHAVDISFSLLFSIIAQQII